MKKVQVILIWIAILLIGIALGNEIKKHIGFAETKPTLERLFTAPGTLGAWVYKYQDDNGFTIYLAVGRAHGDVSITAVK